MAATTETGDAKNLANFTELIGVCESLGDQYAPFATKIQILSLRALEKNCTEAQNAVKSARAAWQPKAAQRAEKLVELKDLAMRASSGFLLTDATAKTKDAIKNLSKTIRGIRIHKPDAPDTTAPTGSETEKRTRSTSQQSIDSVLDNFKSLLEYLAAEPTYLPNEKEMKVADLTAKFDALGALNIETDSLSNQLSAARSDRNCHFYDAEMGLVEMAKLIKAYAKQRFGTKGASYLKINGIAFKKRSS